MDLQNENAIVVSNCGVITYALTYKDVRRISDLITDFISRHVEGKNLCLGLRMSHNVYIPSLVLSLQKLQHAFMFLPENDEAEVIVKELGIAWVLSFTSGNFVAKIAINNVELFLEKCAPNLEKSYEDICYIIRTSGTTGQHKFVKVKRFCIESNITSLTEVFKISPKDVIYFGTPLTFDPSVIELLLALENGACLLMTSPQNRINPTVLHQTLFHSENGITVFQTVPSLFLRWTSKQIQSLLLHPLLKILAFGGEQFPEVILNYEKSPSLRIFNLYGITELSCWASAYEVEFKNNAISIGEALNDTVIEVRDDRGHKITEGEGEIYIGSSSRTCLIGDEEVQEGLVFRATGDIATVNNSKIYYKGRTNDVFKRFGHKLHLSNIEKLIQNTTNLNAKCVWSTNQSRLLVFFIMDQYNNGTKDKVIDKLRIKLLHSLPEHCFPDYIDIIRKCPLTVHGKIDKRTLEQIYLNRDNKDKNLTCFDMFRSLICKYFGLGQCQLNELAKLRFSDIGGNSILAVQLLNEFSEQLCIETPAELVTALFDKDLKSCFDCLKNVQITHKRTKNTENRTISKKTKKEIELKIAWSYNLHACVDSSPLVFHDGSQILVAVGSFSHIFAVVDGTTGSEIAKFILPDIIESIPCLSTCTQNLYVGCFDGKMYCLDWRKNEIKWTYSTGDRIKCRAVLCQKSKALVFGSYDKNIHCIAVNDGLVVWKTFTAESIISTPVLHKSNIFVTTICGTCLCLSENEGNILWSYKIGSPIFGSLLSYKDLLILPSVHGNVICLSADGDKKWEYNCGGQLYSSPVEHENSIILGCHDGNLYFMSIGSCVRLAMMVNLKDRISTTPCIGRIKEKKCIVVATDSGNLVIVDFEGYVIGEIQLPGQVFSSPQFNKGCIYVGCRDNNLY